MQLTPGTKGPQRTIINPRFLTLTRFHWHSSLPPVFFCKARGLLPVPHSLSLALFSSTRFFFARREAFGQLHPSPSTALTPSSDLVPMAMRAENVSLMSSGARSLLRTKMYARQNRESLSGAMLMPSGRRLSGVQRHTGEKTPSAVFTSTCTYELAELVRAVVK